MNINGIDEKQLAEAKALTAGEGDIKVTEDGHTHEFKPTSVFGSLSWSALDGEWIGDEAPESIRIQYGSDLAAGPHQREHPALYITYRDPNGHEFWQSSVVSGRLTVLVDRPPFSPDFQHVGRLEDVRFESGGRSVTLNGSYKVTSYDFKPV